MMKVLAIAMLCHSANMAYCQSIGDNSQVPWEVAPDWQRESAVKGVKFCLANPEAPASANHESWMAEKLATGWVYGEKKDPNANPPTHPCIVAFEELPAEQRFKDVLFKAVVGGCAVAMGGADPSRLDPAFVAALDLGHPNVDYDEIIKLTAERDAAIARAEKAEGSEKSVRASLTKATARAKPRKLGSIEPDHPKYISGGDVQSAIDNADEVQIAFSDGTREVPGLAPVIVAGDAWRDHPNGLLLKEAVAIEGPGTGSSVTIDGYALILDGKQVAYCRRSHPLQVAPGQHVSIADDIIF